MFLHHDASVVQESLRLPTNLHARLTQYHEANRYCYGARLTIAWQVYQCEGYYDVTVGRCDGIFKATRKASAGARESLATALSALPPVARNVSSLLIRIGS